MQIVIPSYKRAKKCYTAQMLKSAIIFCHKFEAEEYKRHNPSNEVRIIPDKLAGTNMAIIRNYILDNTEAKNIVMLDDDIRCFEYFDKSELYNLGKDEFIFLAKNAFNMAKELGTGLWGLNLQGDKKFYWEFRPFSLTNVVLGPCLGIIKDPDLRFDEDLGLKEDYDYSIQALNKYRRILRFNKYHYICDHINARGGCGTYRTMNKELEQSKRLQKKWGSKIVKIGTKTQYGNISINPRIHVPIKGI